MTMYFPQACSAPPREHQPLPGPRPAPRPRTGSTLTNLLLAGIFAAVAIPYVALWQAGQESQRVQANIVRCSPLLQKVNDALRKQLTAVILNSGVPAAEAKVLRARIDYDSCIR